MRAFSRRIAPRLLPALCFGAAILAWLWLYSRFLRNFYYVPNPFLVPLSLLQWLTSFTAAILALARVREEAGPVRRAWFFLALALTLWPLADGLEQFIPSDWQLFQNIFPRPVHILAYGFALISIFFFAPSPRARFGRLRFLVDMIIHAASWGVILWFLLVEPVLQPLHANLELRFWIALYSILDLIVLMLIVWLQGQSARMSRTLWMLAGGFFLLSIHDLVTGWIVLQGGAQAYVYTGFLMIGGYALIGTAAAVNWKAESGAGEASVTAFPDRGGFRWRWRRIEARWLPLVSTTGLAVFLAAEWRRTGGVDSLLLLATLALSLLLFLREGIIAGQAEVAGYAVLLENLEDPAFICDDRGRVILDNPSLQKLQVPARKGGGLAQLLPLSPEWDFLLREAHARGWSGEVWVTASQRGAFPAWLVVQRLPAEEGRGERYAALLHDLSPQRRQEESLREAYQQTEESRKALEQLSGRLEEAVVEKTADLSRALEQLEEQNRQLRSLDRLKSEFVALTSHELRTPLMAIRGGLELIAAQKKPLPEPMRSNLELVRKESERLSRFVENILDLSALEAGRMPLQIGPLRLSEPLESARTALAAVHGGMESRNLRRLKIHLPEGLPDVAADEHILGSILFQLVDNAFKYAPDGPVRVDAEAEEDGVAVTIADCGPGIPAEKRSQLFQMFSRLEDPDSPRVRGVGLGLYISRKMVEAMGGELGLAPSERGLALRIRLKKFCEGS
ncbi:MAG: ATP-binding protein [Anaerolineales bacterium]